MSLKVGDVYKMMPTNIASEDPQIYVKVKEIDNSRVVYSFLKIGGITSSDVFLFNKIYKKVIYSKVYKHMKGWDW